ncbi:hypothetical protein BH11GEM1_BH11GEM1_33740 [soil metagenome]
MRIMSRRNSVAAALTTLQRTSPEQSSGGGGLREQQVPQEPEGGVPTCPFAGGNDNTDSTTACGVRVSSSAYVTKARDRAEGRPVMR